uniref:Uncharacterized protein n=1 Tax=Glossina morsitans morsitans TaxID=37546 RepID=A0A1B0G2X5_GLOMM
MRPREKKLRQKLHLYTSLNTLFLTLSLLYTIYVLTLTISELHSRRFVFRKTRWDIYVYVIILFSLKFFGLLGHLSSQFFCLIEILINSYRTQMKNPRMKNFALPTRYVYSKEATNIHQELDNFF